ncbi:MAG: hypothetical protein PHE09_14650, partial [Oscillospiraceae bacterium]|nr:hypothetical protein [Oscillospiraceae bacterium]
GRILESKGFSNPLASRFDSVAGNRAIDEACYEWPAWKVVLRIGAFAEAGRKREASDAFQAIISSCYDKDSGFLFRAAFSPSEVLPTKAPMSAPWVALALSAFVDKFDLHEPPFPPEGYTPEQCEKWANPCVAGPLYEASRAIDTLSSASGNHPILFTSGNISGCTAQLLSLVAQTQSIPPLDEAYIRCDNDCHVALEHILVRSILQHAVDCGVSVPVIAPWPKGKGYCVSLRHDVDRIPDPDAFQNLLDFEKENELSATWFWLSDRLKRSYIEKITKAGHENALHAFSRKNKAKELKIAGDAFGHHVSGETWHGGDGSDNFLGAPSVNAAAASGLQYSELAPNSFGYPSGSFPMLHQDGTISTIPITGMPRIVSTDAAGRKINLPDSHAYLNNYAEKGGHLIVLNHPDINFAKLKEVISSLPKEGRLSWTFQQVESWWSATHRSSTAKVLVSASKNRDYAILLMCRQQPPAIPHLFLLCKGGMLSKDPGENRELERPPLFARGMPCRPMTMTGQTNKNSITQLTYRDYRACRNN